MRSRSAVSLSLALLLACGGSGSDSATDSTSTGTAGTTGTSTDSAGTSAPTGSSTGTTGPAPTTGTVTTEPDPQDMCLSVAPGWTAELVDPECSEVALAVDGDGAAHLVFVKGDDAASTATGHYATNRTGSFVATVIEPEEGRVRSTAVAVDAAGHVHVSFDKITGSTVRYATDATGSWVLEVVAGVPVGGAYSTLALDAAGAPNIAFRGGNGDLYLATRPLDMWTAEPVAYSGGKSSSLWLEPGGDAHVVYGDYDEAELFVASRTRGTWSEVALGAGREASLVRGGDGRLHASFVRITGDQVELLHAVETAPATWETSQLAVTTDWAISGPSSAVGPDGTLHVAYDLSTAYLSGCGVQLAARAADAAEFTLERIAERGARPRIAVDAAGARHVAYCGPDGLMYARDGV